MCKCVEELTNKLKVYYNGKFKKKDIEDIRINTLISFDGGPENQTYTDVIISVIGQKKEYSVIMAHSHCPFCGEKYES